MRYGALHLKIVAIFRMMKFISNSQIIRWVYLRIYSTCLITLSRCIADVDRTVMKKILLKYEVGLCCLLKEKYDNGLHLPLPAAFLEERLKRYDQLENESKSRLLKKHVAVFPCLTMK